VNAAARCMYVLLACRYASSILRPNACKMLVLLLDASKMLVNAKCMQGVCCAVCACASSAHRVSRCKPRINMYAAYQLVLCVMCVCGCGDGGCGNVCGGGGVGEFKIADFGMSTQLKHTLDPANT